MRLGGKLAARLKRLRVRVDVRDAETIFLLGVPADQEYYSKPRTNVLVKRPPDDLPLMVCVDEDLEYSGADAALVQAFAADHCQRGWRVLLLTDRGSGDLDQAISETLDALGAPADEAAYEATVGPADGGLLNRFGTNLTERVRQGTAEPTVGRAEQIGQLLACLRGWQVQLPVVAGESGAGKTNLLHAAAHELMTLPASPPLVVVDAGVLLAGAMIDAQRDNLLAALLKEAGCEDVVLAIEHLELAIAGVPYGTWLLAHAMDSGTRLIGTAEPVFFKQLSTSPLTRRLELVELTELAPEETNGALGMLRSRIAAHHGVAIPAELVPEAVSRAATLAGPLPAKAITLFDRAAATAVTAGADTVELVHLYLAGAQFPEVHG